MFEEEQDRNVWGVIYFFTFLSYAFLDLKQIV